MACSSSSASSTGALTRSLPLNSSINVSHRLKFLTSKKTNVLGSSLRSSLQDFTEITNNKVLLAATLSAVIGQVSKPLTSALRGRGLDLKAAVRSGGMPSTHSAAVVAAATSLGLERGLSDSIFGMSIVFAALVMYDAQGVRREVGNHAKFLNQAFNIQEKPTMYGNDGDDTNCKPELFSVDSEKVAQPFTLAENVNTFKSNATNAAEPRSNFRSVNASRRLPSPASLTINGGPPEGAYCSCNPLNESVGHTTSQVVVGALLGLLLSLAVHVLT